MQLQNLLQHKKGTSVCVNGHVYKIGLDLVVRDDAGNALDVPQIDADKLLGNSEAWRPLNVAMAKPMRAEAKASIKVIMADGTQVKPDSLAVAPEVQAPVPVVVAETKPQLDPPMPKAGEDWADPEVEYSLAWLQACATAYKIKTKGKDKADLVKKIKAAMYE